MSPDGSWPRHRLRAGRHHVRSVVFATHESSVSYFSAGEAASPGHHERVARQHTIHYCGASGHEPDVKAHDRSGPDAASMTVHQRTTDRGCGMRLGT